MKQKKLLAALILIGVAIFQWLTKSNEQTQSLPPLETSQKTGSKQSNYESDSKLEQAIRNQQRDVQVRGSGKVVRLLADDIEGSRHQKFILKLKSGQTLLIAHNIDLAPRIDNLNVGDTVAFYGEYEWQQRGGVVHWTHHDPNGRHIDGWLKHQGKTYQ